MELLSTTNTSYLLKLNSAYITIYGLYTFAFGVKAVDPQSRSKLNPLADSQLRYLSAMNAATGMLIWWASEAIPERKIALAIIGGMVSLGGLGRAASALQYGHGADWTKTAIWVEILGPALVWATGSW